MLKSKSYLLILSLPFIAASCSPFGGTEAAVQGIYKTVNGGVDWLSSSKSATSTDPSLVDAQISTIRFAPGGSEHIYVGSYNLGLYTSMDRGDSWHRLLSKLSVYDFAIDSSRPEVIYAAGSADTIGRLLKSTDGGKSWVEVYHEAVEGSAVRAVVISPLDAQEVTIGLDSGNLIRSYDGGSSWKLIKTFSDRINGIKFSFGQMFVMLSTQGLYLTKDGGKSFSDATASIDKAGNYYYGISSSKIQISGFHQFVVSQLSPGLIYATTQEGLIRTADFGKTWQLLKLPIKSGESHTRAIAIAPKNDNIVITSVGSVAYKSLDAGSTWQTQNIKTTGYINFFLFDLELPQIIYSGIYAE